MSRPKIDPNSATEPTTVSQTKTDKEDMVKKAALMNMDVSQFVRFLFDYWKKQMQKEFKK